MSDEFRTIEDRLRAQRTELSADERERAWSAIRTEIASSPMMIRSPYAILSIFSYKQYIMIPTLIAILLLAGGGTVVAASDDARPGDALFPVDRAVENVRIAFASDDKKDDLRVRFAEERATEVESIIDEEGARTRLAMEVRAKSSGEQPEAAMMAVSDDTATSDDGDDSDDDGSERIALGLSTAIGYLTQVSAELEAKGNTQAKESVDAVIARLNAKIGDIPEELRIRLRLDNEGDDDKIRIRVRTENEEGDDNDKGEVEVRGDGVRTKVEFKNSEFKIESKMEDDADDDSNDDANDSFEVEADVFTDKTVVKIEHDGIKEIFITQANTRASVVAAVAAYLGVSEASVDAVLDFEIENRASRTTDLQLSGSVNVQIGGDDSDDDSSVEDDDSDDDDNSGSGSDDDDDDEEDDDDNSGSGSGHGGDDDDDDDDDDLLDVNL